MQIVEATLVSKSKDGKRAMVIVRGEIHDKPYTATRHVERQLRNGPFIGANPNPHAAVEREKAAKRVNFARSCLRAADEELQRFQKNKESAENVEKATLNVGRAKASLTAAEQCQQEIEAAYPLQVQFTF